jgi:hypothetical protein
MDEAFLPLHELLLTILPLTAPIGSTEAGILTTVTGCEVATPMELDILVNGTRVEIGGAPPLYHLETSQQPVLHSIRVVIVSKDPGDE